MKKPYHALLFATTCLLFSIAVTAAETADQLIGRVLYTQVNIHSLKGKTVTWVNYQVESLIPVNTEVTIDAISGSKITFTINETGQQLKLKNKQRRSGMDGLAWAKKHFGPRRVALGKFTRNERDAIERATARKGISKDAVITALGYPPAHQTPSLKNNYWLYWRNRWDKFGVNFDKAGKVTQIKN